MLVGERKAADTPLLFHEVQGLAPSDCKALEGYRKGPRVEVSTEAVSVFLMDTRVGCMLGEAAPPSM